MWLTKLKDRTVNNNTDFVSLALFIFTKIHRIVLSCCFSFFPCHNNYSLVFSPILFSLMKTTQRLLISFWITTKWPWSRAKFDSKRREWIKRWAIIMPTCQLPWKFAQLSPVMMSSLHRLNLTINSLVLEVSCEEENYHLALVWFDLVKEHYYRMDQTGKK